MTILGTVTTTAAILAKALTASITADPKVDDGTTLATIEVTLGPGVVLGETVTVSGTGSFDTPAAGLGKTVTSSDLSLGGQTPATTPSTAPQRPRPTSRRSAPSVTASDKTYDGTTVAALTGCTLGAGGAGGVVGTDQVSCDVASATATFVSKNIGSQAVSVSGLTLTGSAAGNYQILGTVTTTAAILAKALTASIAADPRSMTGPRWRRSR